MIHRHKQIKAKILQILVSGEKSGRQIGLAVDSELSKAALYSALDALEDEGKIKSRIGPVQPERGGNREKFYSIEVINNASNR